MNIKEYMKEMKTTRNHHPPPLDDEQLEIVNYCLGLAGEVGELINELKKYIFHRHASNRKKVVDEAGDVIWYLFMIMFILGIDLEEVLSYNNYKLNEKRYKRGFSSEASIERKDVR